MANKKFYVDINLQKHSLQQAAIENLASAPGSPATGQVYFDTTLNKFGVYNGSSWTYLGDLSVIEWQDSAIADIQYIKTTTGAPTTSGATTGELLLNTVDNILYTSTAGDTWNGGVALSSGNRYIFKESGSGTGTGIVPTNDDKIYESDGSSISSYSPTIGAFTSVDDDSSNLWYYSGSAWVAKAFEATTASNGLVKSTNDIQLDLTSLAAATADITNAGTDYFIFVDTNDSNNEKKQTLFGLLTTIAGDGLIQDGTTGKLKVDFATATEAKTGTEASKTVNPLAIADFTHTYSDSFSSASPTDWTDTGAEFTLTYAGSTTNILSPKHVTVKDSTGDIVEVSVNISGSTVLITSNAEFIGSIEITGNGYTS